ncbi:MAG: hypothetical protein AB7F86_01915 [Bdellovibrionales bacterium]
MIRTVVFLLSIIFAAQTWAAKPTRKMQKCERILVSDELQERVNDLARAVAETSGNLDRVLFKKKLMGEAFQVVAPDEDLAGFRPIVDGLIALVNEIRGLYTVRGADIEPKIQELTALVDTELNRVNLGIVESPTVRNPPERPYGPYPAYPRFRDEMDWQLLGSDSTPLAAKPQPEVAPAPAPEIPVQWPDHLPGGFRPDWPPRMPK